MLTALVGGVYVLSPTQGGGKRGDAAYHQQLGIATPKEWAFIIDEQSFAKIHAYRAPVILALKFGTVIYKDEKGRIVTSSEDIAIVGNRVVRPWNYKQHALTDRNIGHKHPNNRGTGLLCENVEWLSTMEAQPSKATTPRAIIVSTGMDDLLGVEDKMKKTYDEMIKNGSSGNLKEFHILNSSQVPQKYLELLKKYKGDVALLLHITC